MRLDDFQIGAEQMLDNRSFTLLSRPVSEAIRMELGVGAPIEAPFGKLMVARSASERSVGART